MASINRNFNSNNATAYYRRLFGLRFSDG